MAGGPAVWLERSSDRSCCQQAEEGTTSTSTGVAGSGVWIRCGYWTCAGCTHSSNETYSVCPCASLSKLPHPELFQFLYLSIPGADFVHPIHCPGFLPPAGLCTDHFSRTDTKRDKTSHPPPPPAVTSLDLKSRPVVSKECLAMLPNNKKTLLRDTSNISIFLCCLPYKPHST